MKYTILIGRVLFSLIFLASAAGHFSPETIAFSASRGVPLASILVPVTGIMMILGGLSIALGYKAKWGALILVLFLLPVTLVMHAFWNIEDPVARQMDMIAFLKNLSMLGAALLVAGFGSGP